MATPLSVMDKLLQSMQEQEQEQPVDPMQEIRNKLLQDMQTQQLRSKLLRDMQDREQETAENNVPWGQKHPFLSALGAYGQIKINQTTGLPIFDITEEETARSMNLGVGAIKSFILDPAQAVMEIPGVLEGVYKEQQGKRLTNIMWPGRVADFIEREKVGLLTMGEEAAFDAGLTREEVAGAVGAGEFIGTVGPIVGAIGTAKFLLRDPTSWSKYAVAGQYGTDIVAGAIYGGVLTPGEDIHSRYKHAMLDSAIFGAGRVILHGGASAYYGLRGRRAMHLKRTEEIMDIVNRIAKGEKVDIPDEELAISIMRLLSEENTILTSYEAQNLIAKFQDERALVRGMIDSAQRGVNMGVIRDVGPRWIPGPKGPKQYSGRKQMLERLKRFKDTGVPGAKPAPIRFELMANKNGNYDVFFTSLGKGLTKTQKKHWLATGRVIGQQIEKGGVRYEYLGTGKPGMIKIRRENNHLFSFWCYNCHRSIKFININNLIIKRCKIN